MMARTGAVVGITHLFAGIPTANFERTLSWYERFLQRPPDRFPHANEAVWQLADAGLVYLVADGERAGNGLITLIVEDLDAWIARLERDEVAHGELEVLTGGVRRTTILDPDHNSITLGQTPAG